ncbi:uncharacterized protein [Cherax quadricarinatus]|uniref:uncharacterized protein n=1 Tax=Cherax quadricarinatus TaxID=27406 RepID=UPI00387EA8CB
MRGRKIDELVRNEIIKYGREDGKTKETRIEMSKRLNVSTATISNIIMRDKKENPDKHKRIKQMSSNKKQKKQRQKQQQQGAAGSSDQTSEPNLHDLLSDNETEGITEADKLYKRRNYKNALHRYEELVNSSKCEDRELSHVFLMMANAYFFTFDSKNSQIFCVSAIKQAKKMGNNLVKDIAVENLTKIKNAVKNFGSITLADDCAELKKRKASRKNKNK